uniref:Uncharacterized protein n=1 Tax=Arundo donax TaxID=35708 RepID=A0A0A9FJ28_ARUDO
MLLSHQGVHKTLTLTDVSDNKDCSKYAPGNMVDLD